MREYVESGYYDRPLTGAAAEYNKALGLSDEPGVMPIEVILPWMGTEHREDALTAAPSEITENSERYSATGARADDPAGTQYLNSTGTSRPAELPALDN